MSLLRPLSWPGVVARALPRLRRLSLPLSAYGKLPLYKDFISIGGTDDGSRELRAWVDRGFSHRWCELPDYRDEELAPHAFLLLMPGCSRYLAGCLWGSTDEGGLRRFPFVLSVPLPERVGKTPIRALRALEAVEGTAAELRDRVGRGASLQELYATYRGAHVEVDLGGRETEPEAPLEALIADLYPDDELLAGRLSDEVAGGNGCLRIPLSPLLRPVEQAELWLRWHRALPGRTPSVRGLFYPMRAGAGLVTLLLRPLQLDDILLLRRGEAPSEPAQTLDSPEGEAYKKAEPGKE